MKNLLLLGVLVAFATPFANLHAQEDILSCDELADIADLFDDVAAELERVGYITEDSELDKALGEVVNALEDLADVEENRSLTHSVKQLGDAWDKQDWDKFKLALDSMIANLDRMRRADCD